MEEQVFAVGQRVAVLVFGGFVEGVISAKEVQNGVQVYQVTYGSGFTCWRTAGQLQHATDPHWQGFGF